MSESRDLFKGKVCFLSKIDKRSIIQATPEGKNKKNLLAGTIPPENCHKLAIKPG